MKFKKEFLQHLIIHNNSDAELIYDKIIDVIDCTSHEIVFSYSDKYYRTTYSCGKTGFHPLPFEFHEDEIECEEVEPKIKQIVVYEPVENKKSTEYNCPICDVQMKMIETDISRFNLMCSKCGYIDSECASRYTDYTISTWEFKRKMEELK